MNKSLLKVALALVAGATFHSAKAQQLQTRLDSMSYSMGMAQTQGLKEYLQARKGVDLKYIDEFVRGLKAAVSGAVDAKANAYAAGTEIGLQIVNQMQPGINKELFGADSTKSIRLDLFTEAFVSGVTGTNGLMTMEEANSMARRMAQEQQEAVALEKYGANKKAGEAFLLENAKKEGVKVLPSGLQYKVLVEGHGPVATTSDKVTVHYEGRLIDGKVFDSSYKRGEPTTFRPSQVIKGWTEALTMMPAGSKWQLYIPQELGYGSRDMGKIPAYSTLVFDVEVLTVNDK